MIGNDELQIIKQLENKLQLSLPADYKNVALNFDEGYPTSNHFEMNNQTEIFIPFWEELFENLFCIDYSLIITA